MTWADFTSGLSFKVPEGDGLIVALAAFGIIGVGATELIQYPYWCLEKGYAKWTGPRDDSEDWERRAKGWIRVLRWDAWASMVIYTFATVAFYLLGAAILGRTGLVPSGEQMVRTFLDDAKLVNEVRGMLGFTGTWKGHKVTHSRLGQVAPSSAN